MPTEHTTSYYAASANATPARPVLQGEHEADVCIVGGGFTGISAALFLGNRGMSSTNNLASQNIYWLHIRSMDNYLLDNTPSDT